jgi:hypothetical protein
MRSTPPASAGDAFSEDIELNVPRRPVVAPRAHPLQDAVEDDQIERLIGKGHRVDGGLDHVYVVEPSWSNLSRVKRTLSSIGSIETTRA